MLEQVNSVEGDAGKVGGGAGGGWIGPKGVYFSSGGTCIIVTCFPGLSRSTQTWTSDIAGTGMS